MIYTVNIDDIEQALVDLGGEARAKEIQEEVLRKRCAKISHKLSNYKLRLSLTLDITLSAGFSLS